MEAQRVQTPSTAGPAGNQPALRRVLTRTDLVIYGLTIITPTAAYPVYGIVQQTSRGHATLSYLLAVIAMLFTAFSYGRMAAAFPSAGSTYTYARKSLHDYAGFLAGWAMILDYVLVPLLSAIYVALTAARFLPQVPYWAWALLFSAGITLLNARGIRVTARASGVFMAVMTVSAAAFAVLAVRSIVVRQGTAGLLVPSAIIDPSTLALQPLMMGVAIATLSYLGFDAISTLAEDTREPERDIGASTVLVCILQTVFCVLIAYLATVVWPASRGFANVETAILDISQVIGGPAFLVFNTLVLVIAAVASSLTSQAGASRLLFGMGRDRMLPESLFGYIHPVYATPTRTLYLSGVVSFVGALLVSFQLIVELVNFGAFLGFILVNLSVIRHYYLRGGRRSGSAVWTNLLLPGLGALVCAYVWINLGANAKLLGFAWLSLGILYLGVLTRGFRRPVAALEVA